MALEAVIFDWGGTLTPFHDVDLLDLWRVAAAEIDPARADELAAAFVAAEADWWRQATATRRSGTTADIYAAVSAATGVDVGEAVIAAAMDAHLDAWTPHTWTDPAAAPLLAALRDRGLRIGLLSNTHWPRARHERWLERDGVLDAFDARIYTSDLPWIKPDERAFRTVLDAAGVADPRAAVFVGDRPLDDIWGAAQLGMRTVLLPNGHVPTDSAPPYDVVPDATIGGLAELLPLIDGWLRG